MILFVIVAFYELIEQLVILVDGKEYPALMSEILFIPYN